MFFVITKHRFLDFPYSLIPSIITWQSSFTWLHFSILKLAVIQVEVSEIARNGGFRIADMVAPVK
jgi:hypothetical protein